MEPAVGGARGPPSGAGAVLGPAHDRVDWCKSLGRLVAAEGWAWEGGRFREAGRLAGGPELERLAVLPMFTSKSSSSDIPSTARLLAFGRSALRRRARSQR